MVPIRHFNAPWLIELGLAHPMSLRANPQPSAGNSPDSASCQHLAVGGLNLCFAGEARLDNRQTLISRLALSPSATDAQIICHAYVSEGEGFAHQLLGDFSFALFDASRQVLLLVRDALGICPLYFCANNDRVVASNSLDCLRRQPAFSRQLNDKLVAEWLLSGHAHNQHDSFYQAVKKCPRATLMRWDGRGVTAQTYWHADDIPPLHYADERDYVQHLRELLHTAVRDRLDPVGPLAAHLSGGLDSSPIALMARRASQAMHQPSYTFNWCKPDAGNHAACHEWDDARQLAQAEGFVHFEIGASAASVKHSLLHHDVARDGSTMFEYEPTVLAQGQQLGIQTIFSGFGGDELLTSRSRGTHVDEVRAGRLLHVLKGLALEAPPGQRWHTLRLLVRLARLTASSLRADTWRHRERLALEQTRLDARQSVLKPEFAAFAADHYRRNDYFMADTILAEQKMMLHSGYHQERMECWATLGRRAGVRYVYPYLDQRLVEFALALPASLYFRHGKPRYLYLQALGDMLPAYLRHKRKLPESYRVGQLIRARLQALATPDVLDKIASTSSPYIDTGLLLNQCQQLKKLDPANTKDNILPVQCVTAGVLALNLNHTQDLAA